VLLVDFDLEAPGITSFGPFAECAASPGIIDYVSQYLSAGEAPNASRFLHRCGGSSAMKGEMWLMPAGRQDAGYGARLTSIDWNDLYEHHQGYLMFEDLKQQWKDLVDPDYVFIDSRTGHTDVGGICTRQLPNAVVLLFVPNKQNITGLKTIVESVRAEQGRVNRRIDLHFVPSDVPDLDDEEGTLQAWIEESKKQLGYEAPSGIIHHYDSMALLDQVVFTVERSRSQLAREYCSLVGSIVSQNLEDREGALATLVCLRKTLANTGAASQDKPVTGMIESALQEIAAHHEHDGELLFQMALIRERMGDAKAAVLALDAAIEAGNAAPEAYIARAAAHRALSHRDDAAKDLLRVLNSDRAAEPDVLTAIFGLRDVAPDAIAPGIENSPAIVNKGPDSLGLMASAMLITRAGAEVAERLTRKVLADPAASSRAHEVARVTLSLSLIARQQFAEACELLVEHISRPDRWVQDLFNYSAAKWGMTGKPDAQMFAAVLERAREAKDALSPNYCQGLAMAACVAGDNAEAHRYIGLARRLLMANPRTQFSAWRYLEVDAPVFLEDLNAIEHWLVRGRGAPLFIAPGKQGAHASPQ
jgi:tetratricopeptide (TPR) repeat protein